MTLSPAVNQDAAQGVQNLLDVTGFQQDLLNPILGLFGVLGGIFTS